MTLMWRHFNVLMLFIIPLPPPEDGIGTPYTTVTYLPGWQSIYSKNALPSSSFSATEKISSIDLPWCAIETDRGAYQYDANVVSV